MDLIELSKYKDLLKNVYDLIPVLVYLILPLSIYVSFVLSAILAKNNKNQLAVFLPALSTALLAVLFIGFVFHSLSNIDYLMCLFEICEEYGHGFGLMILSIFLIPAFFVLFLICLVIFKIRSKKNIYKEKLGKIEKIIVIFFLIIIISLYIIIRIVFTPIASEYRDLVNIEAVSEQISYAKHNALDGQFICMLEPSFAGTKNGKYLEVYKIYSIADNKLIQTTIDYENNEKFEPVAEVKNKTITANKKYQGSIYSNCYDKNGKKLSDEYNIIQHTKQD